MDVIAKRAKIWRKDIEGKNGTFYKYSVGVSRKTQDGKFVNAYIPITFSKRADAPDKIDKLIDSARKGMTFPSVKLMKELVPEFQSKNSIYEQLDK